MSFLKSDENIKCGEHDWRACKDDGKKCKRIKRQIKVVLSECI